MAAIFAVSAQRHGKRLSHGEDRVRCDNNSREGAAHAAEAYARVGFNLPLSANLSAVLDDDSRTARGCWQRAGFVLSQHANLASCLPPATPACERTSATPTVFCASPQQTPAPPRLMARLSPGVGQAARPHPARGLRLSAKAGPAHGPPPSPVCSVRRDVGYAQQHRNSR